MQRKSFLFKALAAIPALLVGKNVHAQESKRPNKGFVVKATDSRFGEKTLLGGKSPMTLRFRKKTQMAT